MSECDPANQTSFTSCMGPSFGIVAGPRPPWQNSGRNFTRISSRASAWRKAQTWPIPLAVPGRLLSRTRPTEDTVSLYVVVGLGHALIYMNEQIAYHAPTKWTLMSRENVFLKPSYLSYFFESEGFSFGIPGGFAPGASVGASTVLAEFA